MDAFGSPLTGTNAADPHYSILSSPGAGSTVITPVTFNCCYFADQPSGANGKSRWISVNSGGTDAGSGTYVYELDFSLSGLDPSTASISGKFAADNHSTIKLNGTTVPGSTDTFNNYTGFTINSAFLYGLNKLDFVVVDDGVVTGLRVDSLAGTASVATGTPEPGTLMVAFSGFAILAIYSYRPQVRS